MAALTVWQQHLQFYGSTYYMTVALTILRQHLLYYSSTYTSMTALTIWYQHLHIYDSTYYMTAALTHLWQHLLYDTSTYDSRTIRRCFIDKLAKCLETSKGSPQSVCTQHGTTLRYLKLVYKYQQSPNYNVTTLIMSPNTKQIWVIILLIWKFEKRPYNP